MVRRDRRGVSVVSETKKQILEAATAMENKDLRAVLMFMVAILDEQSVKIDELGAKIDKMRADEKGLREAVLNGHTGHHDQHHLWVTKQIAHDDEHLKHHAWVKLRMASSCATACDWAEKKMVEEAEDKKSWRRVFEGTATSLLPGALVFAAGAIVSRLLGFFG
jgi:hypothetical protein